MSNPGNPGWPAPGAFSFTPFPIPGMPTASGGAPSPIAGLSGGMDLLKSFWGNLPGSSQVPGFLVPTIDLDELDKRIKDLRAAEQWVEVNLNMLRATIQGLEVQRHTIAALKSMSAMPAVPDTAKAEAWPGSPAPRPTSPAPPPAAEPVVAEPAAAKSIPSAALPGLDASSWLGYMQDQFSKVAQAALSGTTGAATPASSRKPGLKTAPKSARKTARKRPAAKP